MLLNIIDEKLMFGAIVASPGVPNKKQFEQVATLTFLQ